VITPENSNAFKSVLDELKNAIAQSVGENHESNRAIEQIESTFGHIEQKANWSNAFSSQVLSVSLDTVVN
jgi:hypothetical protein